MAMGKRKHARQPSMWVATTDLPAASHPFYARLNQLLREQGFDDFAEGLDSERGIAWRAADFVCVALADPDDFAPSPSQLGSA
jgi:hypothetical protein